MINLKSEDEFQITGRGTVKSIDLNNADKETLVALAVYGLYKVFKDKEDVFVDDKRVLIRGIESFAVPLASLTTKPQFGLLIKEL